MAPAKVRAPAATATPTVVVARVAALGATRLVLTLGALGDSRRVWIARLLGGTGVAFDWRLAPAPKRAPATTHTVAVVVAASITVRPSVLLTDLPVALCQPIAFGITDTIIFFHILIHHFILFLYGFSVFSFDPWYVIFISFLFIILFHHFLSTGVTQHGRLAPAKLRAVAPTATSTVVIAGGAAIGTSCLVLILRALCQYRLFWVAPAQLAEVSACWTRVLSLAFAKHAARLSPRTITVYRAALPSVGLSSPW